MKRRTMDRVNNRRHAERPRREPTEDAGLRAVRVHDIGPELAQHLLQIAIARQSRHG